LFVLDDIISGSILSVGNKQSISSSISNKIKGSLNIWKGLFLTDVRLPTSKRIIVLLSRFSWEILQTVLGFTLAMVINWSNRTQTVSHRHGATSMQLNGLFGGMALAPIIVGDRQLEAVAQNHLFQHEYGHILQSQIWGPFFIIVIGIPSLISALYNDYDTHIGRWQEQDANKKARKYFINTATKQFVWNDKMNPITNV